MARRDQGGICGSLRNIPVTIWCKPAATVLRLRAPARQRGLNYEAIIPGVLRCSTQDDMEWFAAFLTLLGKKRLSSLSLGKGLLASSELDHHSLLQWISPLMTPQEPISSCATFSAVASASLRVKKLPATYPITLGDSVGACSIMVYSHTHVLSSCWLDFNVIERP